MPGRDSLCKGGLDVTYNPLKAIDRLVADVNRDSCYLSRDDMSAIEWRLREVREFVRKTYAARGQEFE